MKNKSMLGISEFGAGLFGFVLVIIGFFRIIFFETNNGSISILSRNDIIAIATSITLILFGLFLMNFFIRAVQLEQLFQNLNSKQD